MRRSTIAAPTFVLSLLLFCVFAVADESQYPYQIGCGSADITGPVVGVQFWGFVRADQIGTGLHLRQRARAFVVADPKTEQRLAIVVCDLGSITHELYREVLDRLQNELGDLYSQENVIITATHTHAAPGGYWHAGVGTPFGSPFHEEYFDTIVNGIATSILAAHLSAKPGNIRIAQGEVPDAGANRSLVAYMNNPEEERSRYDCNTDTTMTLLRFETVDGPIGCLNWFAVHPTTMTYNNKLVSGDSKGYAEVTFERNQGVTYEQPNEFVAAFAQSNCGDVTGNLNLDNTGPGSNEFETTRIIGERQQIIALELFSQAKEQLTGPIGSRQTYIDFSSIDVSEEFAQTEGQSTASAAYGYSFAAGSTEDGGGHPLFREGMTEVATLLELMLDQQFPDARPADALRQKHNPKAILIAPAAANAQQGISQVLSLTVARIGPLMIVAGPAEFTTMSGRRIRDTVRTVMGDDLREVVIAGYSNGYAGYVTTKEEYDTQQYEGGHTLFGPWTLAAYQQEYARLAQALRDNQQLDRPVVSPVDLRDKVKLTALGTDSEVSPKTGNIGDQITAPEASYKRGDTASATFWTSNPQNNYPYIVSLLRVQHQRAGKWVTVASDADWSTKCIFSPGRNVSKPYQIRTTWTIPADAAVGTYRLHHTSQVNQRNGGVHGTFQGTSDSFEVTE